MREKIQAVRTKMVAARYGNPASALSVIVVAGNAGKTTTAKFLSAILKESGRSVACLTNDASISNASTLHDRLATLKKQHTQIVILEVDDGLLLSGALHGLPVETLVIVNENEAAHQLLSLAPNRIIVPTGFMVPTGSVEPYQHISFGEDDTADARIDATTLYRHGTELSMTIDHQTKLEIATYFAGKASALDLAAAIATAYVLGVHLDAVQEGVAELEPPEGLFLWHRINQPYELVYDGAKSDDSIRLATSSAKQLVKRRLIVAFDHLPSSETAHFVTGQADRVFAVASESETDLGIDVEETSLSAYEKALRSAKRDDTVLLLGPAFGQYIAETDPADKDSK